jgi:hypothetical protein
MPNVFAPALSLLGLLPLALAAQAAPPSRVDWSRVADLVVRRTLQLSRGERVVLFWDPGSDRGIAPALRVAIAGAGGEIAGEIPSATSGSDSARGALFARADAAIWLPMPLAGLSGRPFEHLVERSRVRSVHFHWFLPPDAEDIAAIDSIYAAAIAVPPEQLERVQAGLERALRGAAVRITAPNGTDLAFSIPAGAWIHHNTGDAGRAKVARARSVRDREEELPAGVLRTTDLVRAEGTVVGYTGFDTRSPVLSATFRNGRVTRLESRRGAEAAVRSWEAASGDKRLPGEFVIGTNPALPRTLASGFMPYYGYGAGVVRVAIGDNWESGGRNRSSNGEVLLFLENASVTANGRILIREGRLLPQTP